MERTALIFGAGGVVFVLGAPVSFFPLRDRLSPGFHVAMSVFLFFSFFVRLAQRFVLFFYGLISSETFR